MLRFVKFLDVLAWATWLLGGTFCFVFWANEEGSLIRPVVDFLATHSWTLALALLGVSLLLSILIELLYKHIQRLG